MAVKELSDANLDGTRFGQSSTDKVGFYGTTPAVRNTTTVTNLTAGSTLPDVITSVTALITQLKLIGIIL